MAWGLPPKHTAKLQLETTPHDETIRILKELAESHGYSIQSVSPYTLQASLKLGFTFYSFMNFTRPVLRLHVRADEDGNVVFEMRYEYKSGYNSSLNDLGKSKRHTEILISELQQRAA